MKLLWILPYLPLPATSGGKTRQWHLIKTLSARGYKITLLVQSKHPVTPETKAAIEEVVDQLFIIPRRSLKHPVTILACLLSPWPMLTTINGLSPALVKKFSELLTEPWDLIQLEHSYTAQPYLSLMKEKGAEFIITEHNLESSLGGATYNRFPRWMMPFVRFDQWRARRWEKHVFDQASKIIAVTEDDGKAIARLTDTPLNIVVNGVDTEAFAAVSQCSESQRTLFVGNYEYPPNVEAVEWLLNEIAPIVWERHPRARFAIAGHAMPLSWHQRWTDERIEWHGFVEKLQTLQAQCSAFIAPIRQGGGSKLKVLEALAASLPLASTAQGVSGLTLQNGRDYLGSETSAGLAAALIEILDNPQKALSLSQAGQLYVRQNHDWQTAADELEQAYHSVIPLKETHACA